MASANRLIKPYAEPILKGTWPPSLWQRRRMRVSHRCAVGADGGGTAVLLTKLRDPSAGVAARVLTALGELAQVAGEDIAKYLDQLLPMIIEALQVRLAPETPPPGVNV